MNYLHWLLVKEKGAKIEIFDIDDWSGFTVRAPDDKSDDGCVWSFGEITTGCRRPK